MLHRTVLNEMLDDEIATAEECLGGRVESISRTGPTISVHLGPDGPLIELDGRRYDSEPYRVRLVDPAGEPLTHEQWPAGMSLGQHPVLDRPFACIQGTYEYHAHPSHLTDHWSTYRNTIRLADLIDHLLRKAGR